MKFIYALLLTLFVAPVFAASEFFDSDNQFEDHSSFMPDEMLLKYASVFSGYPIPTNISPRVVLLSPEQMAALMCDGKVNCPIFGVYFDSDVIFIRGDLIPSGHDHILFHEMVHWLQHHSGKFNLDSCEDTIAREHEAFQLQDRFIAEVQGGFQFMTAPAMQCIVETES